MNTRHSTLQPTVVTPEQAHVIKPFGLNVKVFLTTETTGGATSVLMGWHRPGEGAPDHVHYDQEELFFIIEGTYDLTVDGKTSTVGPGTVAFIPRGVVHGFKNVGDGTASMLDWTLPGGQDHYFKAVAELAARDGFTDEEMMAINQRFNTEFVAAH